MKTIKFRPDMIQAILQGRKTQTRRPLRAKHNGICPYGEPGEVVWVISFSLLEKEVS